jgi:opacity protein-like surface antigen
MDSTDRTPWMTSFIRSVNLACFASAMLTIPSLLIGARAAESATSDDWRFAVDAYIFMAAANTTTPGGGEINLSFSEALKHLDMAFFGAFEANHGKWSLTTDAMYMKLGEKATGDILTPIGGTPTSKRLELSLWVLTGAAGCELVADPTWSMSVLAGVRYLPLDTTIKLTGPGVFGNPREYVTTGSIHALDGIVGVNGRAHLTKNWYIPYYVDVGTGDTKFTWLAHTGVGYQFDKVSLSFDYRYVEWQFHDGESLDRFKLNGPSVGFRYQF